jgi:death-on-curing protein
MAARAAYACGIARNHPFIDGNKRSALVAALLFLRLNGFDVNASEEEKYHAMMSLAEGSMDEAEVANWFKTRLRNT